MTERKKVRGPMGIIEAQINGEEWEIESPSPDYVPGMGMGATKQATRWAWIGMQAEISNAIAEKSKRPAHRPKKDPLETMDAVRAFAAWRMCKNLRRILGKPDAKITTRELICLIQLVENEMGVDRRQQFFNRDDTTNEQSVSRGKNHLEIDADWNSKVCEELQAAFSQTT